MNKRIRGDVVHNMASYIGPDFLLNLETAAILNSRQSKFPVGSDPWVRATVCAIEFVRRRGLAVLTSVGMNTWELALALAADRDVPAIVVVPFTTENNTAYADNLAHQFHLQPSRAGFMFTKSGTGRSRKSGWSARDELIVQKADVIIPIAIRAGGNMAALIKNHRGLIRDFTTPGARITRHRPNYAEYTPDPAMDGSDLLIHFTRSTGSPWPDESEYDYYMAMIDSGKDYCRSAAHTLKHIIETGIIFGSARHIRNGRKAVGFTRYSHNMAGDLFRYRSRLVNPYFEPYGIGIARRLAEDLGIRPVLYGAPERYDTLSDDDKPYYQNIGADGHRWKGENEWRFIGDFDLHLVPKDAIEAVVPFSTDAELYASSSDLKVACLFKKGITEKK